MSDFKSKLPDLKELGEISSKLFKDLRTSLSEIIASYKQKHPSTTEAPQKKAEKPAAKAERTEKTAEPTIDEKPKATVKATQTAKKEEQ